MTQSSPLRQRLKQEALLIIFGLLGLSLAVIDPHSWDDYQRWLRWPTLASLFGLMLATQGIRDSGWVQHIATALATRMHSLRSLGLLLVSVTAVLAMVLTNDVSLFLLVPLTLAIGRISNLPVLRMVILEALAVNAGSTLSPIGNPQNLLLWQQMHISLFAFAWTLLPVAALMFAMVALLGWCWLPDQRVEVDATTLSDARTRTGLALAAVIALVFMVVMMQYEHAAWGAAIVLAGFLARPRTLRELDWLLLLTFAAIFIGLGHLVEMSWLQALLGRWHLDQRLPLYLTGILTSQVISNVPATVLLMGHAKDAMTLAVAANVGGFGIVIGSLANVIALRMARQPHAMGPFHRVSVPFLLVCAPLAYIVWMLCQR